MSNWDKFKLLELISDIAPGRGTAEHESDDESIFLKNFIPIPDYRRAVEIDTLLILGGRGVGKTELFRLLSMSSGSGRETLVESLNIRSLPSLVKTTWIVAFGRVLRGDKHFPSPEIVEMNMQNASNIDWRTFWIGLILGVILRHGDPEMNLLLQQEIPESILKILLNELAFISNWLPLAKEHIERLNYALDRLDTKLSETDRWLFVTYDELDRLVPSYTGLFAPIRELLAFWLDRWRRWERIRPKIFLRTDLFEQEFLNFPDASKLQAHQIRLEWEHKWLYQLLVKRLANSSSEMAEYLQMIPNLIFPSQTLLGVIAKLDENLFEQLIEKIIGKYMGSGPKKGYTYRWVPNHLQDAGGRIVPRSFLKLFSLAAERRLGEFSPASLPGTSLLQPSDLQGALMDTSEDRILELAREEYPWLEALKTSLACLEVPMPSAKFLEAIQSTVWSEKPEKQPPASNPDEILKYLLRLGIVENRSDGRINMPEIYLYGFKVKRRGGVKRPK